MQNRYKIRIYDADGVGFSESEYIDEDYVTVAVDRAVNAGMDSILSPVPGGKGYLKWYEEGEGTQGYGVNHGQGHKITYTDEVEGSWSTPDLEYLGPFVALHRNTGTRQVWLMIHESAMNDITERDMTGVNEVGLRFVNTELCLGGYNQTAPDGAIWNCQGCTIREGSDPNATGTDASYVNIEVAVEGHGIVPHAWPYNSEEHVGHEFEGQLFVNIDSVWVHIDTVESTETLIDVDTAEEAIDGTYSAGHDNGNVDGIMFGRSEYFGYGDYDPIIIKPCTTSEWFIGAVNVGNGTFNQYKMFSCYMWIWDIETLPSAILYGC